MDGTGAPMADARLVLEAQGEGGGWSIVDGAGGPSPELTVSPETTTTYRWRFVDRPLAAGSESAPFTVRVTEQPDDDGPTTGRRRADRRGLTTRRRD